MLWSIVDSCLYLTLCDYSPSCFDPVYLLLADLWLRLTWIGCISTIKHFPHQKQAAGTLHQQQAAGEAQQKHSAENTRKPSGSKRQTVSAYRQQLCAVHPVRRELSYARRANMDPKKEDTDVRTLPEAPAMPAPDEPGPGPSAVPSVPLHGPVGVVDDSLEGLQSAFQALSVEEVDTNPVKRKREREKDAGESMADEGVDHEHDPTSESTLEGAPSASGLHASPFPTTTRLPTPDPAAAKSTPITTPPMAEGIGFTGMPTYPAYGVDPSTTAYPEATTASEPVASSSAPRWYAADYHHPLPATGAYVDVPGYATLSGVERGPESCGSRRRGSGRSSNRSLTRSEINGALRGATSKIVADLSQEIPA